MKPNKDQSLAISDINNNILLRAGAGTGKTFVLVERYLNILENGNLEEGKEIQSLLAITFTNKASKEMINKIRRRIKEKYKEGDKWPRFYKDMRKANISTIHSFCANILREKWIQAGVDPLFEVLEDWEADKLLSESINKVLSKYLEEEESFYYLIKELNLVTVSDLDLTIKNIYSKLRNIPSFYKDMLEEYESKYFSNDRKIDKLKEIKEGVLYLQEKLRSNAKINKLNSEKLWENFKDNKYKEEDLEKILTIILENLGSSKPKQETIDRITFLIGDNLKALEKDRIENHKLLIKILQDIHQEYSSIKEYNSSLDYDDLQIEVLNLFKNEEILKEYQKKYRYIMVDEFQDSDEIQREIFYRLGSGKEKLDKKNLFFVGDPIQSIYGFRGADLEVFYSVLKDFKEQGLGKVMKLETNYRTEKNLLKFINSSFKEIIGEKYEELGYVKNNKPGCLIEIIENEGLESKEKFSNSEYARLFEADQIARRIRKLVLEGEYNYRDIAILFRSTSNDNIYEEALKRYNIPYYNTGGRGFFQRQEILDLTNSIRAILNLEDFISNIGFLRSPMIGISDEDIFWIMKEEGNILDKLKKYGESKSDISWLIEKYEYLIRFSMEKDKCELVKEILRITDYKNIGLLKSDSRQSLGNIDKFISLIKNFEEQKIDRDMNILEYLRDLQSREDLQAKVESEDDNVVKILTIHKSKGLEYPVIVIPDLAKQFYFGESLNINFDKKTGLGFKWKNNAQIYGEILKKDEEDLIEEEKRILYVAMTRAEELLILGNQGGNSGYKEILDPLLKNSGYVKKLDLIEDLDVERQEEVKPLAEEYTKTGDFDLQVLKERLKNIYEDEAYQKESIGLLSISQFLTFKDCQREYFFKYIKGLSKMGILLDNFSEEDKDAELDRLGLNPLTRGNIVHEFTETYRKGMDKVSLLDNISSKYGYGYGEIKSSLDKYVNNFLDFYEEDNKYLIREGEFRIRIGDADFVGAIDLIEIENNKVRIIDYKTNKLDNISYLKEIYKPQILFYVYAVEELLNMEVWESGLLFLENGDFISIEILKDEINQLISDLKEFSSHIKNKYRKEDYKINENCKKPCQYDIICRNNKVSDNL